MSINTALAAQRKRLAEKQEGFTLIELLVVVIIIGILAAIAIPVFLGQQEAAQNAAYESDLATAKVAYVSSIVDTTTPLSDFGYPGSVLAPSEGAAGVFCLEHADAEWAVTQTTEPPRPGSCDPNGVYVAP